MDEVKRAESRSKPSESVQQEFNTSQPKESTKPETIAQGTYLYFMSCINIAAPF